MSKKRNIGLDIARVCAMVLVWVNHSGFFDLGLDPRYMEYGGVACIELFFVLSGFLVGRSMLQAITSENPGARLKSFYVNRLLRTLPLYYLVLVVLGMLRGQRASWLNFLFLQGFQEDALGFLPPSWSLVLFSDPAGASGAVPAPFPEAGGKEGRVSFRGPHCPGFLPAALRPCTAE